MSTTTTRTQYSSWRTIWTTAKREIQVLMRSKGLMATIAILLIIVIALIGFFTWQDRKGDEDKGGTPVAVVNTAGAEGAAGAEASSLSPDLWATAGIEGRETADRAAAEQLVRDGEVDAAVIPDGDRWDVIFNGMPDFDLLSQIQEAADATADANALGALGVSPEDYGNAYKEITVEPVKVAGEDGTAATDPEADFIRLITTLIALSVIIFTVMIFATNTGSRVTEEKSSRVVELILATVRPLDFLAGKILGTMLLGLAGTALILGVGAIGLAASGLLDGIEFAWEILPITLVSWILAMTFFGSLYAAAGAMVQRTEDLQQTQTPILVALLISVYVPLMGWSATDSTWMQVFSWVPPFSIFAAPLTYAAGDFSALNLALSLALAFLATLAAIWFAARIYRTSILNNGKVTKWTEALKS